MPSRGILLRARLPICALAAVTLHGVAARALPRGHHLATAAVPVADEASPKLDLEPESEGQPAAPAVKEDTRPPSPEPAPARAAKPPADKTKVESAPEDSASETVAESTAGEGDADGSGASGDGANSRGGAGNGGGHEGQPDAPPGPPPGKPHKPTGPAKLDVERDWSKCPFPEKTKRDHAFVRISVVVGPGGEPIDVKVLADPGDGFGDAASACAKIHRYVAGKNEDGVSEKTETEPFLVFFTR